MSIIDSIIGAESGGDPNAKNPNSSATGAGQFINSTWADMIARHRPDLAEGKTPEQILALRNDPTISRQMTEAYATENGVTLSKAGLPVTPGTQYLAHFAGPQGAVSVLSADPNAPVSSILRPDAIKANPFLQGMTAGQLQAWADKKMGGAKASPVSPQSPVNAPLAASAPQPPLSIAPPQAPQAPLSLPMTAPASSGGGLFAQMPAEQPQAMTPIFAPPRRPPDITKLRAALQARSIPGFFYSRT